MPKMGKAKLAMRERARAILEGLAPGERISNPADLVFLRALLDRHPSKDEKIGVGVKAFTALRPDGKSKCFAVIRTDGTFDTFSYRTCIEPPTVRSDLEGSFRTVVIPQCDDPGFDTRNLRPSKRERVRCPAIRSQTGILLSDIILKPGSVPFSTTSWMTAAIHRETIQFERHPHWDKRWWPADAGIRNDFERYHREHAKLRVLSKEGNAEEERDWHKGRRRIAPAPGIETADPPIEVTLDAGDYGSSHLGSGFIHKDTVGV